MDWVLDQLAAIFGRLFVLDNQVAGQGGQLVLGDRAGLWRAELARIPADWLAFGLNRYRERVRAEAAGGDRCWPPTAVQFASACEPTPADLGYADAGCAWMTVCNNAHQPKAVKCPAIRAAATDLWFELRQASGQQALSALERRFRKSYLAVINRVLAGEDITPRQQLEHQVAAPVPVIDRVQLTPEQQAAANAMANRMKRLTAMRRGAA